MPYRQTGTSRLYSPDPITPAPPQYENEGGISIYEVEEPETPVSDTGSDGFIIEELPEKDDLQPIPAAQNFESKPFSKSRRRETFDTRATRKLRDTECRLTQARRADTFPASTSTDRWFKTGEGIRRNLDHLYYVEYPEYNQYFVDSERFVFRRSEKVPAGKGVYDSRGSFAGSLGRYLRTPGRQIKIKACPKRPEYWTVVEEILIGDHKERYLELEDTTYNLKQLAKSIKYEKLRAVALETRKAEVNGHQQPHTLQLPHKVNEPKFPKTPNEYEQGKALGQGDYAIVAFMPYTSLRLDDQNCVIPRKTISKAGGAGIIKLKSPRREKVKVLEGKLRNVDGLDQYGVRFIRNPLSEDVETVKADSGYTSEKERSDNIIDLYLSKEAERKALRDSKGNFKKRQAVTDWDPLDDRFND